MSDDKTECDNSEPPVATLESRSPGEPTKPVYDDVDMESLPEWWQSAVELFQEHELRPYQPARFTDDTLTHEVIGEIEQTHDIDVTFRCLNATEGDDWTVLVNGEPVGSIGKRRSTEGYSVLEMTAAEFRDWIETHGMNP